MIDNMEMGIPDPRPLHVRVEDERRRRGWTQRETAERAGVPLRTYNSFANGHRTPQGRNLRAILDVFEMTETPAELHDRTTESWPADIAVFLDTMGAFLATMTEDERREFIHDAVRQIVAYRK